MPEEVGQLVGINARGCAPADQGWQALYGYLVEVRELMLGEEGSARVLSDAHPDDLRIMADLPISACATPTLSKP